MITAILKLARNTTQILSIVESVVLKDHYLRGVLWRGGKYAEAPPN